MKKLVAFYSRAGENYFKGSHKTVKTGNTEIIADFLKEITGADIYKIEQTVPYSDNYDECTAQAKKDLISKARPSLKTPVPDISEYDEIYLGYPNYWGTMPMAVYTFLEEGDFSGKKIYPFCTHEGSGLSSTPSDISAAAPGANVENAIAIQGSKAPESFDTVKKWTERIDKK